MRQSCKRIVLAVSVGLITSCVYAAEPLQDPIPQLPQSVDPLVLRPPKWSYPIVESRLTCEQAKLAVKKAVERLGYGVTTVTQAASDNGGELKAERLRVWGEKETVTVTLTCAAQGIQINAFPDIPPCEQGNRIARLAIERRGFTVTEFTPAAIGKPGLIRGMKKGENLGVITISCEPNQNVALETSMDGPLARHNDFYMTISNFYQGFYASFTGERGLLAAEKLPVSDHQIHVTMKPLSGTDMKMAFGSESKKYLPVHIEITNRTKHTYQFDINHVMLLSSAGGRVKPLIENTERFPRPALSNQTIAPGTSITGYLYYAPGSYTGAHGSLTEEKSQEREGFDVKF